MNACSLIQIEIKANQKQVVLKSYLILNCNFSDKKLLQYWPAHLDKKFTLSPAGIKQGIQYILSENDLMKPPLLTTFCPFFRSSRSHVFYQIGVLKNFAKFTGKHLYLSLFFNNVTYLDLVTLLEKRLWHRHFLLNFARFFRVPFLQKSNTSEELLLFFLMVILLNQMKTCIIRLTAIVKTSTIS